MPLDVMTVVAASFAVVLILAVAIAKMSTVSGGVAPTVEVNVTVSGGVAPARLYARCHISIIIRPPTSGCPNSLVKGLTRLR